MTKDKIALNELDLKTVESLLAFLEIQVQTEKDIKFHHANIAGKQYTNFQVLETRG